MNSIGVDFIVRIFIFKLKSGTPVFQSHIHLELQRRGLRGKPTWRLAIVRLANRIWALLRAPVIQLLGWSIGKGDDLIIDLETVRVTFAKGVARQILSIALLDQSLETI